MSDSAVELATANRPLKLVVIGDGACGKTSLINHFVHENSVREYNQTVGVEFYLKSICLPGGHNNVNVQVWDIGGQALGGEMLDNYLYGSDGIMLIYDITNETSFDSLEDWLSVVRSSQAVSIGSLPRIFIVGNKCDLEHRRLVTNDRQELFARQHGLASYTLSARTGESVNGCFRKMVADILGVDLESEETIEPPLSTVLVAEIVRESASATSILSSSIATVATAAIYRSPVCALQ